MYYFSFQGSLSCEPSFFLFTQDILSHVLSVSFVFKMQKQYIIFVKV